MLTCGDVEENPGPVPPPEDDPSGPHTEAELAELLGILADAAPGPTVTWGWTTTPAAPSLHRFLSKANLCPPISRRPSSTQARNRSPRGGDTGTWKWTRTSHAAYLGGPALTDPSTPPPSPHTLPVPSSSSAPSAAHPVQSPLASSAPAAHTARPLPRDVHRPPDLSASTRRVPQGRPTGISTHSPCARKAP